MQTTVTVSTNRHTDGVWTHTGRLIVSCRLDNGTVVKVTLPDDLVAFLAAQQQQQQPVEPPA